MNIDFYKLFAASIQDGYVGKLIDIVRGAQGEESLYKMSYEELIKTGLTPKMSKHIINRRDSFDYEKILRIMEDENISFITHEDEAYPKRLSNISSRPYGIFVKGELPCENKKSVAIIGARDCSSYGRLMAEYFGDRLARNDISIISGMAYGIDGIAQMAAIDARGKSYAVLGCGVNIIYPRGNVQLYNRLCNGEGGVISELVPGTKAESRNFPPRNRIISGLSDVVLVVEAKSKSGTLITADMAADQGKDVLVVPGRLTDPLSVGCFNLIKNGALPIVSTEDILGYLGLLANKGSRKEKSIAKKQDFSGILTKEEEEVLSFIDYYPKNIDEIAEHFNMGISRLMIILTKLELESLIKSTSPGSFCKSDKLFV